MELYKLYKSESGETTNRYCFGKLLLSLLAILLCCHLASAQVKVSIVASPQFNENFGVRLGADLDIPLNSRWSIVPGAYWSLRNRNSYKSQEYSGSDGIPNIKTYNFKDRAHFLTVPVRMGGYLAGNPNGSFAIKLLFGPYVAYGIDGTSKFKITNNGIEEQYKTGAFDVNGRYHYRWDYGINTGLNVLLKRHFHLGTFLEVGCRKIYNSNGPIEDILGDIFVVNKINMALGLSFGYQF